MNKSILTLVFLSFFVNVSTAQKEYVLDTLLSGERVFENNKLFYEFRTEDNEIVKVADSIRIYKYSLDKHVVQLKDVSGVWNSHTIKNSDTSLLLNNKLHTIDFKVINNRLYEDVYGRVGNNYVLKKDQKIVLLDTEENKEIVIDDLTSFRVWTGNDNFFLIDDFNKEEVYIYNNKGKRTAKFKNSKVYDYPRNNYFAQIKKLDVKYSGCSIFDIDGKFIQNGFCYEISPEVTILSEKFGRPTFDLFYKGLIQEVNKEWKDLTPLSPLSSFDNVLIRLELKNGLVGVLDFDFNVVLKPAFKNIKLVEYGLITAIGTDNILYIFDEQGNHLNENMKFEYRGFGRGDHFNYDVFNIVKIKNRLFYLFVKPNYEYLAYDEGWNYIGEGKLKKIQEEHTLSKLTVMGHSLPLSFLKQVESYFEMNPSFFKISIDLPFDKNGKRYYQNICDQDGNLIFEDSFEHYFSMIDNNIIEVRKRKDRRAKPTYIRILEK